MEQNLAKARGRRDRVSEDLRLTFFEEKDAVKGIRT